MEIQNLPSFSVVLAGALPGAVLGGSIASQTEIEKRRRLATSSPFFPNTFGVILNTLLKVLVTACIMAFTAIAPLRLGDAYPLCPSDRLALAISLLTGAALAKTVRFWYWKNHG